MMSELLKKYPVINTNWKIQYSLLDYYYNQLFYTSKDHNNDVAMKYAGIGYFYVRDGVYKSDMYDVKVALHLYKSDDIDAVNVDPWNRPFSIFGGDIMDYEVKNKYRHEVHYWYVGGISYKPRGEIPRAILYVTSVDGVKVYCLDIVKMDI